MMFLEYALKWNAAKYNVQSSIRFFQFGAAFFVREHRLAAFHV